MAVEQPYDPKVQGALEAEVEDYEMNIEQSLLDCGSPIEQLLLIELIRYIRIHNPGDDGKFVLDQQYEVEVRGRTYRLDFVIVADIGSKGVSLAIECDGHDFHERTKEQALRDRRRDRDLTADGWIVMRFTGSEIWADARKCVREVFDMLYSKARP